MFNSHQILVIRGKNGNAVPQQLRVLITGVIGKRESVKNSGKFPIGVLVELVVVHVLAT
jgi:hypothetical protein